MELLRAIYTNDVPYFIDLEGFQNPNIKFKVTKDGVFPLMVSVSKGWLAMTKCLLYSTGVEVT